MTAAELPDAADEVQAWYRKRSCPRVDIVGDLAGNELFAIQGESLMAHCIAQANVDYQGKALSSPTLDHCVGQLTVPAPKQTGGFQLLHAVHAVEKFLSDLERCGCRFHIVWFSSQKQLCIPPQAPEADYAKYHLTRAILIEHLNRRAGRSSPKASFEFLGLSSVDFGDYLQENAVQCFVLSDGRSGPAETPKDEGRRQRCLSNIFRLNTHGYSIALLDGLVITSSKVCLPLDAATQTAISRNRYLTLPRSSRSLPLSFLPSTQIFPCSTFRRAPTPSHRRSPPPTGCCSSQLRTIGPSGRMVLR